jgi:3-oxoadipate enol-lactonase
MQMADPGDVRLHYRVDGDGDGAPVVFANSPGTDLRLWDAVVPLLPPGLGIIRFDKRGHGLSSAPPGPCGKGALVRDAGRLLDLPGVRDCVFVGLSVGGMIARGLAVKRPEQVRALVLTDTGARIGTPGIRDRRIAMAREGGIEALAGATMERWFSDQFRATPELEIWRNMLLRTPLEGYPGCCAVISGTDFHTPASGLRLPVRGIAGSEDGGTPPDLVRETTAPVPGSRSRLIRRAGHLPCVDQPGDYARVLTGFVNDIGHI